MRIKTLLLLALCCAPSLAGNFADIAADVSSASGFFSANTKTWSHTTGSNLSNSIIVVVCGLDVPASESATYNSIALTQKVLQNTAEHQVIWYGLLPASGAHNVVITLGTAVNGACGAQTFANVDQNNPIDATNKTDSTTANPSTSITVPATTLGRHCILDGIFENGTTVTAPTTANTQIFSTFNAGGPSAGAASFLCPVNAGANALAWTVASADWARGIISLNPAFPTTGNIQVLPGTGQIGVLPGAGTIGVIHP